MTKLAVILLLVAVLGVVAISAANYPRPPPPVRPIRPFIPPRPPHPRNRRDIDEKPSVNTPKPLVHEPLRPGRPHIQILPATAPPPHN